MSTEHNLSSANQDDEYPAMTAWDEHPALNRHGRGDTPRISVWMPSAVPYGRVETRTVGDGFEQRDVLPDPERPIAYVTISGVQFGGYLSELEMLFAAVGDVMTMLRKSADNLGASDG